MICSRMLRYFYKLKYTEKKFRFPQFFIMTMKDHKSVCEILFIENDNSFYNALRKEIENDLSKCFIYNYTKNILFETAVDLNRFHLIVFDLEDKRTDLELLRQLQEKNPSLPLMIICSELDKEVLLYSLLYGSKGCLLKNDRIEDIKDHLLSSLFGSHISVSDGVFEYMMNASPSKYFIKKYAHRLTDKESNIVFMLQCGLSQKDIAGKLSIAQGTVNQYLNNIYNKLNVNSKGELMNKLFQ
ncbi:MAG: DNA-binding response regulator [Chitinophagaceae bacterium]|nr:DNA-binding response regulator [Chitinophagaceae bacterium]